MEQVFVSPFAILHEDFARLQLSRAPPSSSASPSRPQPSVRPPPAPRDYTSVPWMKQFESLPSDTSRMDELDQELLAFYEHMKPTAEEVAFRRFLVSRFQQLVRRIWPDSRVLIFGSLATELFLPDGDIDICITSPTIQKLPVAYVFQNLSTALKATSFVASPFHIETILGARVPILKFLSAPSLGGFNFDVSLNSQKGAAGAVVCNELLAELDEAGEEKMKGLRARRLIFFFKTFLRARRCSEVKHGGLGGMSAFAMVVSFVQLEPRNPTYPVRPGLDLVNFLCWYGSLFDYSEKYIALDRGGWLGSKRQRGWRRSDFPERLSIQHPVDEDRDLTSGSKAIALIIDHLDEAYNNITSVYDQPDETLLASLRQQGEGVLGWIGIRLTPQLVEHRERNRKTWARVGREEIRKGLQREPKIGPTSPPSTTSARALQPSSPTSPTLRFRPPIAIASPPIIESVSQSSPPRRTSGMPPTVSPATSPPKSATALPRAPKLYPRLQKPTLRLLASQFSCAADTTQAIQAIDSYNRLAMRYNEAVRANTPRKVQQLIQAGEMEYEYYSLQSNEVKAMYDVSARAPLPPALWKLESGADPASNSREL